MGTTCHNCPHTEDEHPNGGKCSKYLGNGEQCKCTGFT